jgi:hypothetical protein
LGRVDERLRTAHRLAHGPFWYVATEADFDSTLIAGDIDLIDAVVGAGDLDATPIEPGD